MKTNRISRAAVIAVMCLAVVLMLKCITKKYILKQSKVGEKINTLNNVPEYYNENSEPKMILNPFNSIQVDSENCFELSK